MINAAVKYELSERNGKREKERRREREREMREYRYIATRARYKESETIHH